MAEGIGTDHEILQCKGCLAFSSNGTYWIHTEMESPKLMTLCLKSIKLLSTKTVKLMDSAFKYTEPHSKRVEIILTLQKEFSGVILQK